MGAILLVRLNHSAQTNADRNSAAIAMAFLAAAWVAAAVRSTGDTDEGGLLMTRATLAAGAMIATLSYATHTHLQLATITMVMALGAILIARRNQVVQYTSLSVLTWSVIAARGNGWAHRT